ncbi:MAG: galactose-1-phosphate uridylyltransferase [Promethearchaeota archaeon]
MNDLENEARFDPILKEWVLIAKNRSNRPLIGKNIEKKKKTWTCPFCPDAPEGAGNWIVKWVPNKFPSLKMNPNYLFSDENIVDGFYRMRPGKGKCEVILFSQDHNASFGDLYIENIIELIKLWVERFNATIEEDEELKYTFIFENRGKIIGVSISHPHGQLYSMPFIPPKIQKMVSSSKEFYEKNSECLHCKIINVEKANGSRLIEENDNFIAFIPYFAKWPLEIHIYPKNHYSSIVKIPQSQYKEFATILKRVVMRLDGLYGFVMPYIMAHINPPIHSGNMDFFHYHIEIYPPYRDKDKLKYLAGVELGTNTIINPSNPSENAKLLRNVKIPEF